MSNLYATIRGDKMTGEIIEKGQGGQTRLDIKLTAGNRYKSHEIGIIRLIALPDGDYILAIDRSSYGGKGGRVYEELITIRSEKKKGELPQQCENCKNAGWVACCNLNEEWHLRSEKKKGESTKGKQYKNWPTNGA